MHMNRRKFSMVTLAVVLAAITVVAPLATAQGGSGHPGRQARIARLLGVEGAVSQLNLTSDQKTQIKAILKTNQTQILQAARDVVKARLDVMQGVPDSATELANARAQAANLREQILGQIKPVLTADQLATLQERKQNREQRLQRLLDRLNSKLGQS